MRMIPYLIFFAGLIGLYYLYQYLFGVQTGNAYPLITANQSAITAPKAVPIDIPSNKLPGIFEGGEFTISTWIYVNNWTHNMGRNKAILIIGGTNFDTLRIYLGATKPTLKIHFNTKEVGTVTSTATEDMSKVTHTNIFTVAKPDPNLLDVPSVCDLPEIDLQRWVNLTVAVNGKTVDMYLDGKLTKSSVLPASFKVDSQYSATLLPYEGFGGQISTTTMYDAALNPEAVYKNYMQGPAV